MCVKGERWPGSFVNSAVGSNTSRKHVAQTKTCFEVALMRSVTVKRALSISGIMLQCGAHILRGCCRAVQGDPCWSALLCLSVTAHQVTFSGCAAVLSEGILSAG